MALRQRQELQVHSSCSDDYFLKNSKMKITSISKMSNIYPCDTMLAWILAMARSVSVTSQCSVERDGRIELVFGTQTSFNLCYTEYLQK